jgi:hypothetical protein
MKTNTPSANALMLRIRNQVPRESEEQHRPVPSELLGAKRIEFFAARLFEITKNID